MYFHKYLVQCLFNTVWLSIKLWIHSRRFRRYQYMPPFPITDTLQSKMKNWRRKCNLILFSSQLVSFSGFFIVAKFTTFALVPMNKMDIVWFQKNFADVQILRFIEFVRILGDFKGPVYTNIELSRRLSIVFHSDPGNQWYGSLLIDLFLSFRSKL